MIYQIKIKGVLDQSWSQWLGNVEIHTETMEDEREITTLCGDFIDQATLFGIIDQIRDLNLFLVSVNQLSEK